jgi:outer membrane protein OmpA-like peptidoglycan-associated protein
MSNAALGRFLKAEFLRLNLCGPGYTDVPLTGGRQAWGHKMDECRPEGSDLLLGPFAACAVRFAPSDAEVLVVVRSMFPVPDEHDRCGLQLVHSVVLQLQGDARMDALNVLHLLVTLVTIYSSPVRMPLVQRMLAALALRAPAQPLSTDPSFHTLCSLIAVDSVSDSNRSSATELLPNLVTPQFPTGRINVHAAAPMQGAIALMWICTNLILRGDHFLATLGKPKMPAAVAAVCGCPPLAGFDEINIADVLAISPRVSPIMSPMARRTVEEMAGTRAWGQRPLPRGSIGAALGVLALLAVALILYLRPLGGPTVSETKTGGRPRATQASAKPAQQIESMIDRQPSQRSVDALVSEFRRLGVSTEVRNHSVVLVLASSMRVGSTEVDEETGALWSRVADALASHPELDVVVEGHSDKSGDPATNRKLSEHRASSLHDLLVKHGVRPECVCSRGVGDTRPVAGNDTKEGRSLNRRVELILSWR